MEEENVESEQSSEVSASFQGESFIVGIFALFKSGNLREYVLDGAFLKKSTSEGWRAFVCELLTY